VHRAVPLLVLALLALSPSLPIAAAQEISVVGISSFYTHPVHLEVDERNARQLDAEGQRNCAAAAEAGGGPGCPSVVRSKRPFSGVRLLDASAMQEGSRDPVGDAGTTANEPGNLFAVPAGFMRGANPRAASGGEAEEIILPGRYTLRAWYGVWNDTNGDRGIRIAFDVNGQATPTNEWIPEREATLVAYIEPGSRPGLMSSSRGHADAPDVTLLHDYSNHAHAQAGEGYVGIGLSPVVFLDGSLLQSVRTTTVAEAILQPDGERPYTLTDASLVDIDVAAAAAPGPVADIFGATLATPVNAIGSPSVGSCPGECRIGPSFATGTALEGPVGALAAGQYVPPAREWLPGSGASNAGRRAEYNASYTPWADLAAAWAPWSGSASRFAGPVPGRAADGRASAMPGVLVFHAWVGLWKDLDGDGFVGAPGEDPYAGGTRPTPDAYADPRGEFHGIYPTSPESPARAWNVALTLTPDSDWSGVVVLDNFYGSVKCGNEMLLDGIFSCLKPGLWGVHGSAPLQFSLHLVAAEPGRLVSSSALLLPTGSPGFTACMAPAYLRHGVNEAEWVHDCDVVARWEGHP